MVTLNHTHPLFPHLYEEKGRVGENGILCAWLWWLIDYLWNKKNHVLSQLTFIVMVELLEATLKQ